MVGGRARVGAWCSKRNEKFLCFAGLGVRGTPYIFTRIEFSTSLRPPISRRRPDSAAKRQNKTLAAEFCEWTTGRRMGKIADHPGTEARELRCGRCGDKTSWACLSCGVALCIAPFTSAANHSPVSCMTFVTFVGNRILILELY